MRIEEDKAIETWLQEMNTLFIVQYTSLYLYDVQKVYEQPRQTPFP